MQICILCLPVKGLTGNKFNLAETKLFRLSNFTQMLQSVIDKVQIKNLAPPPPPKCVAIH